MRSTGWLTSFFIEVVLAIIAPYPFLDRFTFTEYNKAFDVYVTYTVNDILQFLMFLRIYHLLRFVLVISRFMSPRS